MYVSPIWSTLKNVLNALLAISAKHLNNFLRHIALK